MRAVLREAAEIEQPPFFALAAFFEEAFSGATVAPCSATAAVSVVAAFWVVIFV
jgi:hypothetical protein